MDSPQPSSPPPTLSVIPLLIALLLLIIATLSLITIHYIVFRLCLNARPRSNNGSSPFADEVTTTAGGGVDQKTLEFIPVYAYTRRSGESETVWGRQSECVVCLGEFEERDTVRVLPDCGHVFHAKCVDAWFFSQSSCPLCRATVAVESGGRCREGSSRQYTVHCPSWLI